MKQLFNHNKIANRVSKKQPIRFVRLADITGESVYALCDDCKVLGYCKLSIKQSKPNIHATGITIKSYAELIPLRIEGSKFGKYSKFHLQVACDAFHQEDYETAILNFRAALEVGNFSEAIIGLAVAYFMVKDYENAAIFTERYETRYPEDIIEKFKEEINRLSVNTATIKEEAIAKTAVHEIEQQFTNLALA